MTVLSLQESTGSLSPSSFQLGALSGQLWSLHCQSQQHISSPNFSSLFLSSPPFPFYLTQCLIRALSIPSKCCSIKLYLQCFYFVLFVCFKQGLLLGRNLELARRLGWQATKPLGPTCLLSQCSSAHVLPSQAIFVIVLVWVPWNQIQIL